MAQSAQCTTCYLSTDHLGSVRLVTDASGHVISRHDYLPFGEEITGGYAGWTSALGFGRSEGVTQRFTGKERDAESGLDYFGVRYYGSALGRWTSPDWSAKPQPIPYAKLDNPQSLNLYTYVLNNPLGRFDPDGHYVCSGGKQNCTDLREALRTVRDASKSLNLSKEESDKLKKVLDFYGSESKKAGDKGDNGVTVRFANGANPGGTITENGGATVTLDLHAVLTQDDYKANGADPRVEAGSLVAHEGVHGLQQRSVGMPTSREQEKNGEREAFTVDSSVNKALFQNSAYGNWTINGGYNQGAIEGNAERATVAWCASGGRCN